MSHAQYTSSSLTWHLPLGVLFVLIQKIQVGQLFQKNPVSNQQHMAFCSIINFFLISISDEILKLEYFHWNRFFFLWKYLNALQCVENDRLVVWLTIKVLTFEARKISSWGNCEGLKCATWAQGNISEKGEFHKMETAYRGISFLTMDQLQKLAIEGKFKMQMRHPCPL